MGKIYLKIRKRSQSYLITNKIKMCNEQIDTKTEIISKLSSNRDHKKNISIKMENDIQKMIEKWKTLSDEKKKNRSENPILRIWKSQLKKIRKSIKDIDESLIRINAELLKCEKRLKYWESLDSITFEKVSVNRKRKPSKGNKYSKLQRIALKRKKVEERTKENNPSIITKPFVSKHPGISDTNKKSLAYNSFIKKVRKQKTSNKIIKFKTAI